MIAATAGTLTIMLESIKQNARASLAVTGVLLLSLSCIAVYAAYSIMDASLTGQQIREGAGSLYTLSTILIVIAAGALAVFYARLSTTVDTGEAEHADALNRIATIADANRSLEQTVADGRDELSRHAARLTESASREGVLEQEVLEREAFVAARTRELQNRTQQLEAANRELEAFSYSVSHDLRAPLRAIGGFAEILARRHRASLDEQGQHYLDNIVRASANMGLLIDDLLKYSRLGRSAVKLRETNTGELFTELLRTLGPRISEAEGRVTIGAGMPIVWGDRTLLSQIFANLLENALIYHRKGIASEIGVASRETADAWEISILDNGIGIASDQFDKVFQPFQRLHSQDEYPGTGIGLALVRKAAAMLEGRVWVDSAPGAGSTFHLRIPKPLPGPAGAHDASGSPRA